MSKPNFIFFDTETSGGRGLAEILTIDAIFYDYNFKRGGECLRFLMGFGGLVGFEIINKLLVIVCINRIFLY